MENKLTNEQIMELFKHSRDSSVQHRLLNYMLGDSFEIKVAQSTPQEDVMKLITLDDSTNSRPKFRFFEPSDLNDDGTMTVKSEGAYGRKSIDHLREQLFHDLDIVATKLEKISSGTWLVHTNVEITPVVYKGSYGVKVNDGVFLVEPNNYNIEERTISIWQEKEAPVDLKVLEQYLLLVKGIKVKVLDNKLIFNTHADAYKFAEFYINEKIRPSIPTNTTESEFWASIEATSEAIWTQFRKDNAHIL